MGLGSGSGGGGGSGGSIRIEGGTINLPGTVHANTGTYGLGRIAVYYHTSFSGNFTPGYQQQLNINATATPTVTATPTGASATPTVTNTVTPTATAVPTGWQQRIYTYDSNHPHAVSTLAAGASTLGSYTYDANGNMTCRMENGEWFIQSYNTENRISSIAKLASGNCTTPGNYLAKWEFSYDGDGVHLATLTTPYDGSGTPGTPSLTSYFFGGAYETRGDGSVLKYYSFAGQMIGMKDSGGMKYFLTDHLGSVVSIMILILTTLGSQIHWC